MAHDAHGHDAHGHGGHDAAPAPTGDPHALPPEPTERSITPAPEDFATTPPFASLMWPVAWAALAALLIVCVRAHGWHVPAAH
jgi:hypothetical protein